MCLFRNQLLYLVVIYNDLSYVSFTPIQEKFCWNGKSVVLECYNQWNSEKWKDQIAMTRQRVGNKAAKLPQHVVNIYLTHSKKAITKRIQGVVRKALAE